MSATQWCESRGSKFDARALVQFFGRILLGPGRGGVVRALRSNAREQGLVANVSAGAGRAGGASLLMGEASLPVFDVTVCGPSFILCEAR